MELPKGTVLDSMEAKDFGSLVQETVMGSQGKFGAYGVPSDVKLARVNANLYKCKFTVLTPAMRESDRTAFIAARQVGVYHISSAYAIAKQLSLALLGIPRTPRSARAYSS